MTQIVMHPLLAYVMLAAGMGLCLYLFCSLKIEIRRLQRKNLEEHVRLESTIRQLDLAIAQAGEAAAAPAPVRASELDATRRTQALRMDRRGESPATIAGALGVPRNEIDLMLKLHRQLQ